MLQQAAEDGITDTDGSPLDFKEKFDPWVDQGGFPLLNIQQTEDGVAEAYQSRFLFPPDQEVNIPSPWEWVVHWYLSVVEQISKRNRHKESHALY